MRFLRHAILVLGMTALGMVLGFYGLATVVASMQRPGGEPWQAGYGQYLGGLIVGVPFGGLCGLGGGVALMRPEPWGVRTWLGIIMGLAVGPFVGYFLSVSNVAGWWGVGLIVAACGTVGGLAGGLLSERHAAWDPDRGPYR